MSEAYPEMFDPMTIIRPPLRWHGGKFRLASWVIAHFVAHLNYVEVFGGAAGILLRRKRAKVEVYNDLDEQVVGFFRVLRDAELCQRLIRLVDMTPFSRAEFELSYAAAAEPVEAARRFVVRCFMGHGTCSVDPRDSNGFRSCDIRSGKSYAREWAGVPAAIAAAADRLQGVTIEHMDFRKLIPKFDAPETLFYIDPPYLMSTRNAGGKGYVHEMDAEAHRQLGWLMQNIKGKAVVSHYPHPMYDEMYAGWHKVEKATTANGQRGAVPRTECLWMNFAPPNS
jgi:DNA adenine methylase